MKGEKVKLGRRDFLKGLGATAAVLLVPRGLGETAEAEQLVTPDHGGLLVPPVLRGALIEEFELSKAMWSGADLVDVASGFRGRAYFVDSSNGELADAPDFGLSPDAPCASINYALSLCADRASDVIYVLPGHVEGVTTENGLVLGHADTTIRGVGNDSQRPSIHVTFTECDTVFNYGWPLRPKREPGASPFVKL